MYALAANIETASIKEQLMASAKLAQSYMNDDGYPAAMFDYVKALYDSGQPWEETRDDLYKRYQVDEADGYDITSQNLYCNGCFAAGINYAACLVSLFFMVKVITKRQYRLVAYVAGTRITQPLLGVAY